MKSLVQHEDDMKPPSLFEKQHKIIQDEHKTRYYTKRHLLIDSSKRNKKDQVITRKIDTIDKYIKLYDSQLIVIVLNPKQLSLEHSQIPDNCNIIFRWVTNGHTNQSQPKMLFGTDSLNIIFSDLSSRPILQLELIKYEEDTDRGYYIVKDVTINANGFRDGKEKGGRLEMRLVESITEGYPTPGKYKLNLQYNFKNVVSIKMISSMFPIPKFNYHDINDLDYFVYLEIPKLLSKRNIFVNFDSQDDHSTTLIKLIENIGKITTKLEIYPVLTYESYIRIQLLRRVITTSHLEIYPLQDSTILYQNISHYHIPGGHLVFIHDSQYSGIYRSVTGFLYKIKIDNDSGNQLKLYDSLYLKHEYIGTITKINKDVIEITTNYKLNEILPSSVVNTHHRHILTVLEIHYIGSPVFLLADKICDLPNYTKGLSQDGIYILQPFKLDYSKSNYLSCFDFHPKSSLTYSLSDYSPSQEIEDASIERVDNDTLVIKFPYLQKKTKIFQIVSILDTLSNHSFEYTKFVPSLVDQENEGEKTRVYFEPEDITSQEPGSQLKTFFKNTPGEYLPIIEKDEQYLVLDKTFESNNPVIGARIAEAPISLVYKPQCCDKSGVLTKGVLRGDYDIELNISCNIQSNYIIQIGKLDDHDKLTNVELNIIQDVEKQEESENYIIHLKYPLSNSWLQHTPIYIKYLYLEIEELNSQSICVYTELQLDKIEKSYGIINWNSAYIYDIDGIDTELNEEPVMIEKINYLGDNEYELVFNNPLQAFYPKDENYYIVLFLDLELNRCEPSTSCHSLNSDWETRLYLTTTQTIEKGDEIEIIDMKGINIPIYGLSDNDKLSRQITDKDLDITEESLSQILKDPHYHSYHKVIDKQGEYISIRGKFMGYNGKVKKKRIRTEQLYRYHL